MYNGTVVKALACSDKRTAFKIKWKFNISNQVIAEYGLIHFSQMNDMNDWPAWDLNPDLLLTMRMLYQLSYCGRHIAGLIPTQIL